MQAACELGAFRVDILGFGRTAFVRARGEDVWEASSSSEGGSLADLAPERTLKVFQAASLRSRRLGEDSVRGDSTVRHELTVDCARANLECAGATVSAEVWVDDEGLVRRISVDDGTRNGVLEFFDFGVAVAIEPPPHDQIEVPAGHHFGSYGRGLSTTCTGGGTPISAKTAVAALRRNGLTVSWEEDTRCREGVAAKITNEHEGYRVFEVEGLVKCSLLLESEEDAWSVVIREDGSVGGRGVELELENLHCVIVSGSIDDENVRGFEQAFTELERTIRP